MSTARSIRRFTDEPVDDDVLRRCFEAATWAPSGANFQAWRFVILRSPEQRAVVAAAAAHALAVIEPVYRMTPAGPRRRQQTGAQQPRHLRAPRPRRRVHVGAVRHPSVHVRLRVAARRVDLSGGAELPAGRPRHRARRLSDELGRLRGRGDAARRGRRARHVDAGIACRRGMAARSARSTPPPPRSRRSSPSTTGTPPPGATPRSGTPTASERPSSASPAANA